MRLLLILIGNPHHQEYVDVIPKDIYYKELNELGILTRDYDHLWHLNMDKLREHSVIVSDELYDNMQDIDWLREQRKKIGAIQGRLKGREFREAQQARRKERRAYAKIQKAKRLAQPPVEMPLSEIIFSDVDKSEGPIL